MGTLRDEAYEKLDYLSQLTEIVVSPQNEILGRLPDRLELTLEDVRKTKYKLWGYKPAFEISATSVLRSLLTFAEEKYIEDLIPHFELQGSDDLEIDFNAGTMTGSLCLVKLDPQIEEKKLLEIAVTRANNQLTSYNWSGKRVRERVITILNTLIPGHGTTWAQQASGRIAYHAVNEIARVYGELILENKWRIRDAETIIKVGKWINSYMEGDDVGLMNLLKLKIMIDKDLPIYSVDEVKHVKPT